MTDEIKMLRAIELLSGTVYLRRQGTEADDALAEHNFNAAMELLEVLRTRDAECDYNLALFIAITPLYVPAGHMSIAQYIVQHKHRSTYLNQLVDDVVDDVITDSFHEWNMERRAMKAAHSYKCEAPPVFKQHGISKVNVYSIETLRSILG